MTVNYDTTNLREFIPSGETLNNSLVYVTDPNQFPNKNEYKIEITITGTTFFYIYTTDQVWMNKYTVSEFFIQYKEKSASFITDVIVKNSDPTNLYNTNRQQGLNEAYYVSGLNSAKTYLISILYTTQEGYSPYTQTLQRLGKFAISTDHIIATEQDAHIIGLYKAPIYPNKSLCESMNSSYLCWDAEPQQAKSLMCLKNLIPNLYFYAEITSDNRYISRNHDIITIDYIRNFPKDSKCIFLWFKVGLMYTLPNGLSNITYYDYLAQYAANTVTRVGTSLLIDGGGGSVSTWKELSLTKYGNSLTLTSFYVPGENEFAELKGIAVTKEYYYNWESIPNSLKILL